LNAHEESLRAEFPQIDKYKEALIAQVMSPDVSDSSDDESDTVNKRRKMRAVPLDWRTEDVSVYSLKT
jgi:hypothetical protein